MTPPDGELRCSPLHREHLDLGATMTETDGWAMPEGFAGVLGEYRAHRRRSVVWDASNLGSVVVSGPGAAEVVGRTLTNDVRRIGPGRSQYSFLLDEDDAGIVDDLVVWWVRPDRFVLTPNRPDAVVGALRAARDAAGAAPCAIEDTTARRVLLAVQGAAAAERAAELVPEAASMGPRRVAPCAAGIVATTGFGGRVGFELHVDAAAGPGIYRRLVDGGAAPAGLAVRETLRFESGVPRHGVDLGPHVTPLEAGFGRAVCFDTEFPGRAALLEQRRRGPARLLRMLVATGRRIPPAGARLLADHGPVGRVTSSNFSFRLHRAISFALLDADVAPGTAVRAVTDDGAVDAEVSAVPVDLAAHQPER